MRTPTLPGSNPLRFNSPIRALDRWILDYRIERLEQDEHSLVVEIADVNEQVNEAGIGHIGLPDPVALEERLARLRTKLDRLKGMRQCL